MQKKIKIAMIIVSLLLICTTIGSVSAATHQITNQSYSNYFNATGHIKNTNISNGDVLDLSGTLTNKNMNINRTLRITSSGKTGKLINGTITVYKGGSGSSVTNLTIENHNQDGSGILLYETENVTVQGNKIYCDGAKGFGIPLTRSHNNKIIGNTVIMCGYPSGEYFVTHTAIPLGQSNYNTIADNYIASDGANGIYLSNMGSGRFESNGPSYYNNITNNTILGADTSTSIAIQMMGSYNQAINNTILSQTFPEKKSKSGIGPYMGIGSSNDYEGGNSIINNTVSATNCGISVYSNGVVSGNKISLYKDTNTSLTTDDPACGIRVGSNCTVTNNTVNMINGGDGFYLEGSNSTISGNIIINIVNGYGVYLNEASNNIITKNNITSTNTTKGSIGLYSSSVGNRISENIINSKNTGILFIKRSKSYYPKNTIINDNKIITTSTYAVNSTISGDYSGTPNSIITNNFLVSNNSAKLGNAAVYSMKGDTVSGNYGVASPIVKTIDPANGATKVAASKTIKVTFNKAIKAGSNFWVELKNSKGTSIAINKSIKDTVLTIDPVKNLAESLYTIIIHTGTVTDLENRPVALTNSKFSVGTPPKVTKIDPKNGAVKVSTGKTIKVTFNEAIKKGSKYQVELKNSKGKKIAFKTGISGKVLTIKPNSKLAESLYTLTLHTGSITDLAGNPAAAKNSKFSVGTPPKVTKIDPKNGAVKVAASKTIKVTFNEAIKKSSKFRVELKNSAGKKITIKTSISGKVLTIKPTKKLAESRYKLTIYTGSITDLAGNPAISKSTIFTTGTPPKITKTDPKNNAKNIARTKTIKVTFNEAIKAGKNYRIELVTKNTKVAIKKSIKGKTLTIKPNKKLKPNTRYTLKIYTGSITDKVGNPIALKTSSFTTRSV